MDRSHRTPPSLPVTLAVFLVCGPLLSFWAALIVNAPLMDVHVDADRPVDALEMAGKAALGLLMGGLAWLIGLLRVADGWMVTLLPTTAAAIVYRLTALWLVRRGTVQPATRPRAALLSALVACGVSVPVFALAWAARAWLAGAPQAAFRGELVLVVAVDAVLVGLVLGLLWRRAPA